MPQTDGTRSLTTVETFEMATVVIEIVERRIKDGRQDYRPVAVCVMARSGTPVTIHAMSNTAAANHSNASEVCVRALQRPIDARDAFLARRLGGVALGRTTPRAEQRTCIP